MKAALLVGVRDFEPPLPRLPYSHRNVEMVKDVLIKTCGFAQDNIRIMLDQGTNYQFLNSIKVMKELKKLLAGMGKRDVVLFYYAAHGGRIPANPNYSNNTQYIKRMCMAVRGDYISDCMLQEVAVGVPSTACFTVISNCCHSGGMVESLKEMVGHSEFGPEKYSKQIQNKMAKRMMSSKIPRAICFTACQSDQIARYSHKIQCSYFTNALVTILEEKQGQISNLELIKLVATKVTNMRKEKLIRKGKSEEDFEPQDPGL